MTVCTKFLGPNITPQLLGSWNYTNNFMNLERGAEAEPEPLEITKPQIILQLCKLQNLSQNPDNSHHVITHQRRKEINSIQHRLMF